MSDCPVKGFRGWKHYRKYATSNRRKKYDGPTNIARWEDKEEEEDEEEKGEPKEGKKKRFSDVEKEEEEKEEEEGKGGFFFKGKYFVIFTFVYFIGICVRTRKFCLLHLFCWLK